MIKMPKKKTTKKKTKEKFNEITIHFPRLVTDSKGRLTTTFRGGKRKTFKTKKSYDAYVRTH
tara:strand:+ start:302 stop:487 length:186 start_codon:yes stop_codon:yes gene_type:complete